jgi:hypothetical protein
LLLVDGRRVDEELLTARAGLSTRRLRDPYELMSLWGTAAKGRKVSRYI